MGVTLQRRAGSLKTPKKRRSTAKQDRRDAKGLRLCIPHDNDEQFDQIMYYFDRLVSTPMRQPSMVRYGKNDTFFRLKHGNPPKYYKLMRRSPKKKPSLYPSKTATLKRLLVFTVPDSGEDTRDFLDWYMSRDEVLNKVYRSGDPAIRTYVFTEKGIGANYVKPRALRPEELPKYDASLFEKRSCRVLSAAYWTRVATVSDEWKGAMKGCSRKEMTQVLRDSPELRQHDVRFEEEFRGWFVGGEETEYDTEEAAKARAAERQCKADAQAQAPSRSEKVLSEAQLAAREASRAAAEAAADAEDAQQSSLFFLKMGAKVTKEREKITRKRVDSRELMEEKKKTTLQRRQQKLAEAEAALAADPANAELKKKASEARVSVKKQQRVVQHATAEREEAAMRAKDAKKHDNDKGRLIESVQDMTPEEWAVEREKQRLQQEKDDEKEMAALAPGELPPMALLPREANPLRAMA